MRCLDDGREGMKHRRSCGYRERLDMRTLVCTRGRDFPIDRLATGCAVRAAAAGTCR
jgi:hypothetical protein